MLGKRQKARPRKDIEREKNKYNAQKSRLQETTKIRVAPFLDYWAYGTNWRCPKSLGG